MKRTASLVALTLLLATTLAASDTPAAPTPSDRENLLKELRRTEELFLASVEGLTEAQWNFKPAPDKWSIAQVAEHLAASEPMLRGMIGEAMKKELPKELLATSRQDEMILKTIPDRSKKFQAPEPLVPTNRYGSPAESVAAFTKERGETIKLASTDVDLRTHGDKHFLAGSLDAYGWFLFQSGHVERHTRQIEEVKSSAGFPK